MRVTRRILRDERGSVVVAMMSVTFMLVIGLATYSAVGTQTRLGAGERVRESAFNLTEGVLSAQTFLIGRLGPGSQQREYPAQCDSAGTGQLCPDPARVAESFDPALQADYANGQTSWTTWVRDNGSGDFYDDSVNSQPTRDANGDNKVWVKARGVVRGSSRTLVALVKVEERHVEFPRYALTAGFFGTTNNGRKVIVDTGTSLGIAVRCATPATSSCLDYQPDKGQVSPHNVVLSYPNATAISQDDLAGLEELAQAQGTYYTSCPENPNGLVVVVESGDCSYNNSTPGVNGAVCCNAIDAPGLLVIKNGTLSINGNIEFRGIVYALNQQGSTGNVVSVGGTALVRGGVLVDGPGGIAAGASATNVVYDPRPFDGARSFGTAGIVQNTWRELPE